MFYSIKTQAKRFRNQKINFHEIYSWLEKSIQGKPEDILITMEATGVYHETIALFLYGRGFKLFLSNPGKAKKFSQSQGLVHKTDKSDAAMLAKYGSTQPNSLKLWQPESDSVREIKTLIRRLNALEKDRLRENNRLEASVIGDSAERVIQSLTHIISVLDIEIIDLQNEIDKRIERCPEMRRNRDLLLSISGIGKVMARELVYLFSAKKFVSAKQVAAYVGLIPKLNESGTFKGRTTLSKTGPSRIRSKLFLAAVCAGTHNEESSQLLSRLLEKHNISKDDKRVYFSQLLGMSDHISYNEAKKGYNVVKYVPYGPIREAMPYLIRRAKENTSVAGQTSRELTLIRAEIARRKS